jgi:hypothetical protein
MGLAETRHAADIVHNDPDPQQGAWDTRVRFVVRVAENGFVRTSEGPPVLLPVMQLNLSACARSAG